MAVEVWQERSGQPQGIQRPSQVTRRSAEKEIWGGCTYAADESVGNGDRGARTILVAFLPPMKLEVLTELEVLLLLSSALSAIYLQNLVAVCVLLQMKNAGPTAAEHSGLGDEQMKNSGLIVNTSLGHY